MRALCIFQQYYNPFYLKKLVWTLNRLFLPCGIGVKFFELVYQQQLINPNESIGKWSLSKKDFSICVCLQSVFACDFTLKMKLQNFLLHEINLLMSGQVLFCCGLTFVFQYNLMNIAFKRTLTVYSRLFQMLCQLTCNEVRPSENSQHYKQSPTSLPTCVSFPSGVPSLASPDVPCYPISTQDQCRECLPLQNSPPHSTHRTCSQPIMW